MSILFSLDENITPVHQLAQNAGIACTRNGEMLTIDEKDPQHDSFLRLFDRHPDFAVFYGPNTDQPQVTANSHFRQSVNNPPSVSKPYVRAKFSSTSTVSRTAIFMAKYYNYPAVSSASQHPVIAVISLGGGYKLTDLQYYWKTVCGNTVFPSVINCPVGQAAVPAFNGTKLQAAFLSLGLTVKTT